MIDRKSIMAAIVMVAVAGFTAACESDSGTGVNGNGGDDVVEVRLTSDLTFSPAEVTIEPGMTVRWVNDADIFHTVTPDGHSEWTNQEMSTAGETFEHTFSNEGSYPYYCEPHLSQGMTGTITVESSGTTY